MTEEQGCILRDNKDSEHIFVKSLETTQPFHKKIDGWLE